MGSVNVAESLLEEVVCEDGDPDGPLMWDKTHESFTDFLSRVLEKASPEDEVELTEEQQDDLVQDFERVLQEYSGR